MVKQVLVLAAHPDDETLGCGGYIRRLIKEGCYIKLIVFTNGESSRDSYTEDKNRNILLDKVCAKLGITDYAFGDFPDNRMDSVSLLDLCKFIEKNVNFEPDIILTHHRNCLNIDHQLVYRATITAFRPQRGKKQIIYSYFVVSSTDYNPFNEFQGNVFVDIENELQDKIDTLRLYDKEMREYPHTRSYENITNMASVNGSKVGLKAAECFELVRSVS